MSECKCDPGQIDLAAIYSIEGFSKRTGLGVGALRVARERGLKVYYCHNRAFIRGADWDAYVSAASTEAPGPAKGTVPRHLQNDGGGQS
jgi:hypothetical protein